MSVLLYIGLETVACFSIRSQFLLVSNNNQVAFGELELNPEFNLMQLSVEDFENKIQVKPAADCCHWAYVFPFIYCFPNSDVF